MMINDRLVESCVRSFFRHQISKMLDRAHAVRASNNEFYSENGPIIRSFWRAGASH